MTSLERPLPLTVVIAGLILASILGFVMGLTNALKDGQSLNSVSTAPLAEISGVPVRDASPAPLYVPAPPEKPKPKAVEAKTEEVEVPAAVIEAPPAAPEAAPPAAPPPQQPPPARIEDLYE